MMRSSRISAAAAWAVLVLAVAQAVAVVLPLWLLGTDPNSDESTC